jgi:hypothetical protein
MTTAIPIRQNPVDHRRKSNERRAYRYSDDGEHLQSGFH